MIIRRQHNSHFSVMPNSLFNDESISIEARGLMGYLLSKPDNWHANVVDIQKRCGVGRSKAYRLIAELSEAGYIIREAVRKSDGTWAGQDYIIKDQPDSEDPPCVQYRDAVSRHADIEHTYINTDSKKELKEEYSRKTPKRVSYPTNFEAFWKAYPTDRLMSKSQTLIAWKKLPSEDQEKATQSLNAFTRYCEKDPTYRVVHAERYLKWRRFDGFCETATDDPAADLSAIDTERWKINIEVATRTNQWSDRWGPAPGAKGCHVPPELITPDVLALFKLGALT